MSEDADASDEMSAKRPKITAVCKIGVVSLFGRPLDPPWKTEATDDAVVGHGDDGVVVLLSEMPAHVRPFLLMHKGSALHLGDTEERWVLKAKFNKESPIETRYDTERLLAVYNKLYTAGQSKGPHPNIPAMVWCKIGVENWKKLDDSEDPRADAVLMPFVGNSLSQGMRNNSLPLEIKQGTFMRFTVLVMNEQISSAVDYMNKHELEHRDLCPQNIVWREGIFYVIDFDWAELHISKYAALQGARRDLSDLEELSRTLCRHFALREDGKGKRFFPNISFTVQYEYEPERTKLPIDKCWSRSIFRYQTSVESDQRVLYEIKEKKESYYEMQALLLSIQFSRIPGPHNEFDEIPHPSTPPGAHDTDGYQTQAYDESDSG